MIRFTTTYERLKPLVSAILFVFGTPIVFSAWADSPAKLEVDFSRQIRPLLAKQCFSCHGPDKQESGVALHEFEKATIEADSGMKPIVPGDLEASEILRRVASNDPDIRMPPEGKGLSKLQVELLTNWVKSGAEYREHWAFLPLSNPTPPAVAVRNPTSNFVSNPVDAFVQEKWETNSLKSAAFAEPKSLVRRLFFDCIGVPPDLETVERFVSNPSEDAYAALVDQLLADPRFGDRKSVV